MSLHLQWGRYFYDLFSQILRHIGTALAGWGGLNVAHAGGADVPALNFKALGIFLVAAAVIPALSSFWQKTPLPEVEETTVTIKTTKTTTPPNETNSEPPVPPAAP